MAREVSRKADGAKVFISRCRCAAGEAIAGPESYDGWEECNFLVPLTLEDKLAPAYPRLKLLIDFSKVEGAPHKHVWDWREFLRVDDRISIRPRSGEGAAWFCGFVADCDITFSGGQDETATVTAIGSSARLARDCVIYGRFMYQHNPPTDVLLYTALATHFNPGGVPNKHPLKCTTLTGEGVPAAGLPVFTFDGDLLAEWWTLGDVLEYLSYFANPDELWISNPDATLWPQDSYADDARISLDVTGMLALAAMAAACDLAAWDLAERCADDGKSAELIVTPRGRGNRAIIQRQKPAKDGERPQLDFGETNLFTASLAESTVACVTRPTVAGGRDIYQITITLKKAWVPTRLSYNSDWDFEVSVPNADEYARKFVTTGLDHENYADVCRLWDANTDGRYGDAPWSYATQDMGEVFGFDAGKWPHIPYRPLPLLTTVSVEVIDVELETVVKPPSCEAVVEITFDGGTNWRVLEGWTLARDRLAVMLTRENLAEIDTLLTGETDPADYFFACWKDYNGSYNNVKVRLTCCVESPYRAIERPARRTTAGTGFETTEWFDKGELGQYRHCAASSVLGGDEAWSDEADGTAAIEAAAEKIQDVLEDRTIEALLPLEWLEGAPQLTDVVESILGLDYALPISRGLDLVYPRVVARTLDFQNWSCALSLGTERKSGTVFRPGVLVAGFGSLASWRAAQ